MNEILNILLKITIVIFMADNLLDLGLRVNLKEALRGLRDVRFVTLSVVWAFVLSPAMAYALTLVVPLTPPYAIRQAAGPDLQQTCHDRRSGDAQQNKQKEN